MVPPGSFSLSSTTTLSAFPFSFLRKDYKFFVKLISFHPTTSILLATFLLGLASFFLSSSRTQLNLNPISTSTPSAQVDMLASMSKTVLTSTAAIEKNAALKFKIRPSQERGKADHGWLKTFHTFNFANYYHPSFGSFGPLRVINEDRVDPNEGFGTHPHAEFEIFSYIVRGELEHRDSMGNLEIMKRGDIQMTSAGTGIRHSEYNRNTQKQVHFLQIWALPNKSRLPPTYYTRHVTDAEKREGLVRVVGPNGTEGVSEERETSGPAPVHADLHLFATLLPAASTVHHVFQTPLSNPKSLRKAYIHVVQTSGFNLKESLASGARVKLNGELELGEGDGAFVTGGKAGMEFALENVGKGEAEVLVFDMGE